jgi:hypothetical protein
MVGIVRLDFRQLIPFYHFHRNGVPGANDIQTPVSDHPHGKRFQTFNLLELVAFLPEFQKNILKDILCRFFVLKNLKGKTQQLAAHRKYIGFKISG